LHAFSAAATSASRLLFDVPMGRDHTKLRFFPIADGLTLRVYRVTESLPAAERYGLQSQMRRASVSVVTNVVEGACRRTDKAYSQFLEIALGSASEVRYLLELSVRLRFLEAEAVTPLVVEYSTVVKGLQALITTIADSRKPKAESRKPIADSR
jgi:four helix bundle protein